MARGAAKQRAARPKPAAQRKRTASSTGGYGVVEQTMFFPRLRRQAKWVFVFLAAVFAIGFVFFGVGSGSTGISDVLRGNFPFFGGGTHTSSAADKAKAKLKKNPKNAVAWREYATALQQANKPGQATKAWEHYVRLRPSDYNAFVQIGSYYTGQGEAHYTRALALQGQAPVTPATAFGLQPSSPLGQALSQDQVQQTLTQKASKDFSAFSADFKKAVVSFKHAAKLRPSDQFTVYELARTADIAGDTTTALSAYKRFLKLAPDDPQAARVRQRVAQLAVAAPAHR
jgi:tetratricopeptide (TPR) repeat protein